MSFGFHSMPDFRVRFAVDAQRGKPSSGAGALECNSTYFANIGIQPREADLTRYGPKELLAESKLKRGDVDVLISCAPCTGFSRTLGKNHVQDDPRNHLVERTATFVDGLRPKILLMENARELLMGRFKHHAEILVERLHALGYAVLAEVRMLSEFGLPQNRERALLVAAADNSQIRGLDELWSGFAPSPRSITVRHSISGLPPVVAGEVHPADDMHVSPGFSDASTLRRLQLIPRDGGSWSDLLRTADGRAVLTPAMNRSAAQGDFGSHPDVYGRLWWDKPCVTIKRECAHVGNGRYSHPIQDRLCTVRELSLLNGFPSSYKFVGSLSNKYRHIGDAVPPLISHQLAAASKWMLTGRRPSLDECLLPGTTLRKGDLVEQRRSHSLFDSA